LSSYYSLSLHDALPISTSSTTSTSTTTVPVNEPPNANDDFVTIEAGSTETIPVLANDTVGSSDLDPASLAITLAPARGLATTQGDRKSTRLNSSHVKIS